MEQLLRRVRGNSDEKLVHELKDLLARDCALEADLLVYIGEVDHRGLYRDEGCSSMFAYAPGCFTWQKDRPTAGSTSRERRASSP